MYYNNLTLTKTILLFLVYVITKLCILYIPLKQIYAIKCCNAIVKCYMQLQCTTLGPVSCINYMRRYKYTLYDIL